MSEASHIPGAAGRGAAGPLRARRCVRHEGREAVARCPSCGGFFCRECVSDHAGRLVCADCLAREAKGKTRSGPGRLAALRGAGTTLAAVLAAWLLFYGIGTLLMRIPADFHEGTIWRNAAKDGDL